MSLQVGQVAQKPSALRLHLAQITLLLARAAIGRGARGLGELQECRQPMVNAGGHHLRLRVGLARPDGKSGQRKAGEVTFGKKKLEDPTRKLEEEILGKK